MHFSFVTLLFIVSCAFALPKAVVQHYGYIEVNPQYDAQLFYWFFESQSNPATDPVILWMTGGPGCSSELALFFENGPWTVNPDLSLDSNPYSWNTFANLLYVDQPAGTGFSTCSQDYVTDEDQMSKDMYTFLQKFFALYPQYAPLPFYIIGESYGGHYVPALAAKIVQENLDGSTQIPLVGIGIGNGWVDPEVQYGAYAFFGYENNLINATVMATMSDEYAQCVTDIEAQNWNAADNICGNIMGEIMEQNPDINVYNIELPCIGPLCYDMTNITNFLNLPAVQKQLGVNVKWTACSDTVNEMFGVDREQSYRDDVPFVMNQGVRVLVYSGMLDLICNYVGGAMWTAGMPWTGQKSFVQTPYHDWVVDGQLAGHARSFGNFTWLEVEASGHMVPHDQPSWSLALLKTFLSNTPF